MDEESFQKSKYIFCQIQQYLGKLRSAHEVHTKLGRRVVKMLNKVLLNVFSYLSNIGMNGIQLVL
jgi:hypothetical protein